MMSAVRRITGAAFCVLLATGLQAHASPQTSGEVDGQAIAGHTMPPVTAVVIDFQALASREAARSATPPTPREHTRGIPPIVPRASGVGSDRPAPYDVLPTLDVSPPPTVVFPSLGDTGIIPPDTMGAVGPRHLLTTLNGGVMIQDKSTGAVISSVTMSAFWASTGATNPFDPKALFDPYNERFILAAVSDARSTASSMLLGISATSDPTGAWLLYRYPVCIVSIVNCGATGAEWWADYPEVGFNRHWIALTVNMFGNADNQFRESRMRVFDYPLARVGAPPSTIFASLTDFTIAPTVTYSPTESRLFTVTHEFGSGAVYRLGTIEGSPGAPAYTLGAQRTHTLLSNWAEAYVIGSNAAPQAPEPGTGLVRGIDQGDSRVMNAVFRNNAIWYAQTVALPAVSPTHTAVQWVKLSTDGSDLDAGRIEDPTATATNGGRWYAYPSIAVNAQDDALIGTAVFSSTTYPSGGYALRTNRDVPGTMRDVTVFARGVDFYYKTYTGSRNRWGDFTATQVDPGDERLFWTIQESSVPRVGAGNGSGRWLTTWAKVDVPVTRRIRPGDFDGDGESDLTVFRPGAGTWYTLNSGGGTASTQWGNEFDIPAPGDYDGDGRFDVAVFRPDDGTWYLRYSGGGQVAVVWGNRFDRPVPADYDGDGRTDIAVFRPSEGTWHIRPMAGGSSAIAWGNSLDALVPADYDGDGAADVAVFRPDDGTWYVRRSAGGWLVQAWGLPTDTPVPGDYDGDGRADWATFRPSTGEWWVLSSLSGGISGTPWGSPFDIPVPGDYDGDGRTDLAVYRPWEGTWYILNSASRRVTSRQWGSVVDHPINRRR